MCNFQRYSAFYDLLYGNKDYSAEAHYVAEKIRRIMPRAHTILELGSGTGRHGRLLAEMGFDVYGIERSSEMVSIARAAEYASSYKNAGSFACEVGDICTTKLQRTFDAVISLFHVMSYQATNCALQAAFQVAADHLALGGPFVFDVWHGPAVLSQKPSERVKEAVDERYWVQRVARPQLDTSDNTVNVVYDINCEDRVSGEKMHFSEEHLMRYIFPTEIDVFAEMSGFRRVVSEEFLTEQVPSSSTWSVIYVLQR